ncbi:DUF262 domain-containing protein [Bradyrhizobium sp. Arg68]|uniref:DUF262 domain-containing protein n=1 Tax=Bradyrhizobium ivorense TaxID=2511166 RepID=UPI001E48DC72|nr:DUF262 domain-containing protein [Bradyrhizobium ivorense]MCC8935907.1 DUF262 domain-containing protein [Bradyrhizobium ivorense]
MQPVYHPLVKIFGHEIRHTVPLFQRPYVWSKDENWAPLWDDLRDLAHRVLTNNGQQPVAGHFLGTVVLEQALSQTGSIGCREVIDGQQRLTTLQIILKATNHVLTDLSEGTKDVTVSKSLRISAKQIDALIANPAYAEDEERYKVWPTNEDREAFRHVMDADASTSVSAIHSRMAEAYHYFFAAIDAWLKLDGEIANRASAFASAIKDHLRLIVLDLDDSDEPQAIFETLNAHGAPLLPADLMKNWLLWQAQKQNKNIEQLYNSYWRSFDKDADYWRAKIGTGHASRARVDTFLQYWLTRRTNKAITTKHLYDQFLKHAASKGNGDVDVTSIMLDVKRDSECFCLMDKPQGMGRLEGFFVRLKIMDVSVFYPFLLELMRREGSNGNDRELVAEYIESYLVRRMVCGKQTRSYGTLALSLIDTIRNVAPDKPAAAFIKVFLANLSDADLWPDDTAFEEEWNSRKFYGGLRRERVAMILQAIEEQYHRESSKSEPVVQFNFSNLQIEHIMPQEWKRHWPLAKNDPNGATRSKHIHGIGNLTLVSQKLNPSLSHAAWLDSENGKKIKIGKRSALKQHSNLQLNARLISAHPKRWDESGMQVRTSELFRAAQAIWKSPQP